MGTRGVIFSIMISVCLFLLVAQIGSGSSITADFYISISLYAIIMGIEPNFIVFWMVWLNWMIRS
jgi:hypothetical protein